MFHPNKVYNEKGFIFTDLWIHHCDLIWEHFVILEMKSMPNRRLSLLFVPPQLYASTVLLSVSKNLLVLDLS